MALELLAVHLHAMIGRYNDTTQTLQLVLSKGVQAALPEFE